MITLGVATVFEGKDREGFRYNKPEVLLDYFSGSRKDKWLQYCAYVEKGDDTVVSFVEEELR